MGSFLEKYNSSEWKDVANDVIKLLKNVKRYIEYPECNNLLGVKNEETKKKVMKRINKLIRDFIK